MGLLDKLKNVFFEEEIVEVEEDEEPIEPKEKVTVAKKIENPEVKKAEEEKKEEKRKEERMTFDEEKELETEPPREHRFPMTFDDKDFEVEKTIELEEPVREETKIETPPVREKLEEYKEPVIEETREFRYEKNETIELVPKEDPNAYRGLYEGSKDKEEKPVFTPSPIISPIYGILNKNYKKEEIVTKKEIRLSQASSRKADLDVVREKAYGDLANDISLSIEDEGKKNKEEKENLLYDLNEEESPTVKVVTVGDAEEYFNDLGLEYNVDYKVEKEEEKEKKVEKEEEKIEPKKEEHKMKLNDSEDEKNLFDLIDSMYEDKE